MALNREWEGHSRPEAGPPGGIVHVLSQWENSGGRWEILKSSEAWVTVGLMPRDDSEQMRRVTSARTAVLTQFLAQRSAGIFDAGVDR